MTESSNRTKENGDLEVPFIVDPNKTSKDKSSENSGRCCKCTRKRCGIASAVIVIIIGLIIGAGALRFYASMTGTATSADSEKWNQTLQEDENKLGKIHLLKSIVDGEYSLASFGENYRDFLEAMGMPSMIAVMVSGSKEIVTYTQPRKGKQEWSRKIVTDFSEDEAKFVMESPFNETTGSKRRKVTFLTTCILTGDRQNTLDCTGISLDEKATEIRSVSVFSGLGYVEKRTLVKQGITTTKYFKRLSALEVVNQFDDEDELEEKLNEAEEEQKGLPKDEFEDFKR